MAEQQNDPEMSDDELYAKHNFEEGEFFLKNKFL